MSWSLINRDKDDEVVRGPFDSAEAAAAVRRELESCHPYYREEGNLWIIDNQDTLTDSEASDE